MQEIIVCPGCQATLTLPALPAGQTVQCPRCQRVFAPAEKPVAPAAKVAPERRDIEHESEFFLPPSSRLAPPQPLVGTWFGYFTMVTLVAFALACSVRAYVEYELSNRARFEPHRHFGHGFVRDLEGWQSLATLVAIASFAIWLFLVARNARNLRATGFSLSPGWVIAIFCCPVLNVIFVYLTLQEIWKASDPQKVQQFESWRTASPGFLIRMWGIVMLATPLTMIFFRDAGVAGGNLLLALAAALLVPIIYFIHARQLERYIRLYENPD
jgi:hypothetical protein